MRQMSIFCCYCTRSPAAKHCAFYNLSCFPVLKDSLRVMLFMSYTTILEQVMSLFVTVMNLERVQEKLIPSFKKIISYENVLPQNECYYAHDELHQDIVGFLTTHLHISSQGGTKLIVKWSNATALSLSLRRDDHKRVNHDSGQAIHQPDQHPRSQ